MCSYAPGALWVKTLVIAAVVPTVHEGLGSHRSAVLLFQFAERQDIDPAGRNWSREYRSVCFPAHGSALGLSGRHITLGFILGFFLFVFVFHPLHCVLPFALTVRCHNTLGSLAFLLHVLPLILLSDCCNTRYSQWLKGLEA